MADLERKKISLELIRVSAAKLDLEIKIDEMKREIKRLEDHIIIQDKKETELKERIEKL